MAQMFMIIIFLKPMRFWLESPRNKLLFAVQCQETTPTKSFNLHGKY